MRYFVSIVKLIQLNFLPILPAENTFLPQPSIDDNLIQSIRLMPYVGDQEQNHPCQLRPWIPRCHAYFTMPTLPPMAQPTLQPRALQFGRFMNHVHEPTIHGRGMVRDVETIDIPELKKKIRKNSKKVRKWQELNVKNELRSKKLLAQNRKITLKLLNAMNKAQECQKYEFDDFSDFDFEQAFGKCTETTIDCASQELIGLRMTLDGLVDRYLGKCDRQVKFSTRINRHFTNLEKALCAENQDNFGNCRPLNWKKIKKSNILLP